MSTIQKLYDNLSKNTFFNLIILGATPMFGMLVCIIITLSFLFTSTKAQVKQNVENTLEIVSISKKITMLEMKELNERQRAEHSQKI